MLTFEPDSLLRGPHLGPLPWGENHLEIFRALKLVCNGQKIIEGLVSAGSAAIDLTLLLDHLRHLAAGEVIGKPRYSFESHTRIGAESVAPGPLVFVEGLFTLWWEPLRSLLDLKVFVEAPPDLRLVRRIRRDIAERGRTVEQVLEQYVRTVRPMHERYVAPTRAYADLVVTNDGKVEECLAQVVAAVQALPTRPAKTDLVDASGKLVGSSR